jgi:hypothetical protein
MGAQTDAFNAPLNLDTSEAKALARRLTVLWTGIDARIAARKAARLASESAPESERQAAA